MFWKGISHNFFNYYIHLVLSIWWRLNTSFLVFPDSFCASLSINVCDLANLLRSILYEAYKTSKRDHLRNSFLRSTEPKNSRRSNSYVRFYQWYSPSKMIASVEPAARICWFHVKHTLPLHRRDYLTLYSNKVLNC